MNRHTANISNASLRKQAANLTITDVSHGNEEGNSISLIAAIVVIFVVAANLRPSIVSIGPVLSMLRSEFHLTNAQASLLISIPTLLMGLLAIPTPLLARRFGRNPVVLAALALLGTSTLLRSLSTSGVFLLIATAATGAGIAIVGALVSGFVKAHHPTRASMLMGLYAASLGLGSTIAALFTGPVAHFSDSWRVATAMWSIPVVGAIAAWLYVSRFEQKQQLAQALVNSKGHGNPAKSLIAWMSALYFAANNFLFCSILTWIVPISVELGVSTQAAGPMLAIFTMVFMVANPIPGLIGTGTDRRKAIAFFAIAFLGGISVLLAGLSDNLWIPIGLIGLGVGGSFSLGMMLPLDNTNNPNEANSWTSFSLAIGYGIGALGPLVLGHLRDTSHDFQSGLWVLAGVGFLELCLSPFLFKKMKALSYK